MVNVLIDTQLFHSLRFHFDRSEFGPLLQLVDAGTIRIFITSIIDREVKQHICEQAATAQTQLRKVIKANDALRHSPKVPFHVLAKSGELAELTSIRLAQWADWKVVYGVTTISALGIDIESLTNAYFDAKPPFGPGKKKQEFPDAIILAAANKWTTDHAEELIVLSGDHGFKEYCEHSPRLIHMHGLAPLFESFTAQRAREQVLAGLGNHEDELSPMVFEEFPDGDFVVNGEDCEVECADVLSIDIKTTYVTEMAAGTGIADVEVDVEFYTKVTRDVPIYGYGMDEESYYYGHTEKEIIRFTSEATILITITFAYDERDPRQLSINTISMDSETRYVRIPQRFN